MQAESPPTRVSLTACKGRRVAGFRSAPAGQQQAVPGLTQLIRAGANCPRTGFEAVAADPPTGLRLRLQLGAFFSCRR